MAVPASCDAIGSTYYDKIGIHYECMTSIEKLITILGTIGLVIIIINALRGGAAML